MRTFLLLSISLLTLGLSACSSGAQDAQPSPIEPAAQEEQQVIPVADSISSTASSDDHHAGETNVAPHDDSASSINHHEGEANIVPHDDSASSHDDSNRPPHRD